jgi:hypothetical protein
MTQMSSWIQICGQRVEAIAVSRRSADSCQAENSANLPSELFAAQRQCIRDRDVRLRKRTVTFQCSRSVEAVNEAAADQGPRSEFLPSRLLHLCQGQDK